MTGMSKGKPWKVLKGNHDRLMEWFFNDPHKHDPNLKPDYSWLHHRIGGVETLASYGVKVPENYRECLDAILIAFRATDLTITSLDGQTGSVQNLAGYYNV